MKRFASTLLCRHSTGRVRSTLHLFAILFIGALLVGPSCDVTIEFDGVELLDLLFGDDDSPSDVDAPPAVQAVSFSNEIQPIFDVNCTVCHISGGIADAILHLNAEESFDALVGQASVQDASLTRVVAGDSSTSLLFQKVGSDFPPVGARMPLGGAPLSDADIALIRDWIDQGAPNN